MKRIIALLLLGDDRAAYIARHHVTTYQERRAEVFKWYGAACACRGERDMRMLSLDHVQRNESDERKVYRAVRDMWKNHEMSERYQLLCLNCNQAKGSGPECSHMREVKHFFLGGLKAHTRSPQMPQE
jgi:hypothetical protein